MNIQKIQNQSQENTSFGNGLHINRKGYKRFYNAFDKNKAVQQFIKDNPDSEFYVKVVGKKARANDAHHIKGEQLYKVFFSSAKNFREKIANMIMLKSSQKSLTRHYHTSSTIGSLIRNLDESQLRHLFK